MCQACQDHRCYDCAPLHEPGKNEYADTVTPCVECDDRGYYLDDGERFECCADKLAALEERIYKRLLKSRCSARLDVYDHALSQLQRLRRLSFVSRLPDLRPLVVELTVVRRNTRGAA